MAEGKKKVRLHYGGETFDLPAEQADVLDGYDGEPGTVRLNLGSDKWLTIAMGPGIPIAVSEWVQAPARIGNIR